MRIVPPAMTVTPAPSPKALAAATSSRLIRLQCYEGLDVAHAVYEWNYSRQLLHIRAAQEGTVTEEELFGPEFLIRRPLLEAIESTEPVVLLIDEIDRADEEFEAFLLEVLLEVGRGGVSDALHGLDAVDLARRDDVYWTLRQTLVSRADDLDAFDRAFAAWFLRAPELAPPRRPEVEGMKAMSAVSRDGTEQAEASAEG